jgi:hypothetical protein
LGGLAAGFESTGRVWHQVAEVFDGEPGHGHPGLDRGLAERLGEVTLTGAARYPRSTVYL